MRHLSSPILYFNPTLVQLELPQLRHRRGHILHFNPTLVQLEYLLNDVITDGVPKFQSHIGAIRINYRQNEEEKTLYFNPTLVQLEYSSP